MKKIYYRTLLTIVIVACLMPFVIKGRDGRPLLQLTDLKMPALAVSGKESIGRLGDSFDQSEKSARQTDKVTVYRWQDDQGIWHFSDAENPAGHSEAVQVSLDKTVPAMPLSDTSAPGRPANRAEELLAEPLPLLHAGEVLEQARNVETVLRQRYQRQEQLVSRQ